MAPTAVRTPILNASVWRGVEVPSMWRCGVPGEPPPDEFGKAEVGSASRVSHWRLGKERFNLAACLPHEFRTVAGALLLNS